MLEELKAKVCKANLLLKEYNLVLHTWGNVSERDKETGYIVIKPSGVSYENMKPSDMVVVDINGNIIEGDLKPSSDTKTHLEIYKKFNNINGVAHTHSLYATSWAQSGADVIPLGTTHADYFYGSIKCTRALTKEEVNGDYEKNTGLVITEYIDDPKAVPGILVFNHGPFTWGSDSIDAAKNASYLEYVCNLAYNTININSKVESISKSILDKHYFRKHGPNAYYGQKD